MSDCFFYVTSAPYFWHSMVATTASSLWIGALLYNGDLKLLGKGLIALMPYVLLLTTVTIIRLRNVQIVNPAMAYAGLITILMITFFYVLGLILGVFITKLAKKRKLQRLVIQQYVK